MNRNVEEAARRAGFYIAPSNVTNVDTARIERFARLLIDEAMRLTMDKIQSHSNWNTAEEITASIKKHFGV
jgi:hypothetical protein